MEKTDSILAMLKQQQSLITRLEGEVASLASTDTASENKQLRQSLLQLTASLETLKQEHEQADTERKELHAALKQQLYHEKFLRIRQAERRADALFEKEVGTQMNRLESFELGAKRRIGEIAEKIARTEFGAEQELNQKFHELDGLVTERIDEIRKLEAENASLFRRLSHDELSALYNTQITEAQAQKAVRSKNIESIIGLNIINKIGILLLVLGTVAAGRFAYVKLPDTFKTILIFLAGLILAGFGEGIRKKTSAVFSQGLISGGVAILYVGLVTGYLTYNLFSVTFAFLLCIAITILAFFLSLRHHSQTISVFALIGGFLPLITLLTVERTADTVRFQNYTVIAVYLAILSLFTLAVSFFKRWDVTRIASALLNLTASFAYLFFIVAAAERGWLETVRAGNSGSAFIHSSLGALTLTFFAFSFITALAIPLLSALRNHLGFRKLDVAYIAFAGAGYAMLLYLATEVFFGDFRYTPSITLFGELAVFALLAFFIRKHLKAEKNTLGLLFAYSFILSMLIPYLGLLDKNLIFAWAPLTALFFTYGVLQNKKTGEFAGWVALGFSLLHFLLLYLRYWRNTTNVTLTNGGFLLRYTLFALCILAILGAMIYKNSVRKTKSHLFFSCFAAAFLWLFAHVALNYIWIIGEGTPLLLFADNMAIIIKSTALFAALLVPFTALRSKRLFSAPLVYTAAVLYSVSFLMANWQNAAYENTQTAARSMQAALILFPTLANLAAVLGVFDATRALLIIHRHSKESLPLPAAVAFVVSITGLLLHFSLRFTSPVISTVYLAFALALITFGFLRRFTFIRHFGLGLTLVSLGKLFLLDFSGLSQQWRIASYFAFGMLLIAISFTYQFFNKRAASAVRLTENADEHPPEII